MDEKELQALLDQVDGKVKSGMQAVIAGLLKAEDFEAKLNELKYSDMTIKEVVEAVTKQGEEIRKIIDERNRPTKVKTLGEFLAPIHTDLVKSLDTTNAFKFKMNLNEIRTKTTVGLSSITSDPGGMIIPGFTEIQSQANRLSPSLNQFTLGPDSHGIIYWTDMTTRTNNAAARSDGSAAAEQVYAWTGRSETVDNISAKIPVHLEALKHISQMEGELRRLLNDDCLVALDGYCYTGSGTAPEIGGLYTRATAFDAAAFITAGGFTPTDTGIYDLVLSMAAQISKATKYIVDKVWLNPYDVLRLRLARNKDGNFLFPQYALGNGAPLYIGAIQVIESNSVTANTCVVGDSRKATLYSTGNAEITAGYDTSGDFGKRIITLLANLETSLLIKNAEVDAFLKSTNLTTDIAAIKYSGS